jgi:hypothetical protein
MDSRGDVQFIFRIRTQAIADYSNDIRDFDEATLSKLNCGQTLHNGPYDINPKISLTSTTPSLVSRP